MSREAFPQLPANSQAHIENFPPDLKVSTVEKISALSHAALHSEGVFEDVPVPQAELGEEHQPYIDSVSEHMEETSQLLSSAHSELNENGLEGQEVSFEMLAEKAKEIAIRSAKEAKQSGDKKSAVKSLESLLIVESLRNTRSTDQTKRSKSLARIVTAEGLATELVEATHDTFGLVVIQEYGAGVVPLNTIAQSSRELLRAATPLDFTDDFSDYEKADAKSDVSDLNYGDLLALAKLKEAEHPDTGAGRDLIKQALKNTTIEQVEPVELVEILSMASELSLNDEVGVTLSELRVRRRSGSEYRGYDYDEIIVKLVQRGEIELARGLISSSSLEADHLKFAVERQAADVVEGSQLISTLEKLHQDKQAELRQHLQSTGVEESIVNQIIQSTVDPDSAINIPTEFWQKLEEDSSLKEILLTNGGDNLAKAADALSAIDSSGMIEHRSLLLQKVLSLEDSNKADTYLASFRGALDILGVQQESEGVQNVDMRRILTDLADFEDPVAALEAAKKLYGTEEHLKELRSLYDLVHPQYGNDELARFRAEDISAIGILRDYCTITGIEANYIKDISASLMVDEDPLGRSQNIAEGLRLANITADSNPMLFFDVAKGKDPISLGRAISVLENSLTNISAPVRQDILMNTVSNQDPEQTALLLVRTQQELQNQQLTIDDIGVDELYRAMRIVENSEDSKDIERFCSNWKIKSECEDIFKKYLQPVRESGGRKDFGIEQKPTLADLPETRARFEQLGISPEHAEGMLDSWLTFSAHNRRLYNDSERGGATAEDIDATLAEQSGQLLKQTKALTNYVERFGIEETIELSNTFGIYNFIRYHPEQLHNQMISWKSGEVPTRNVVVSARADWNSAVSDVGKSFERVFGEDGLFNFEVNDRIELSKVAVSIGNRERAMGRDPETDNALDNFVIDGHANPKGILLGTQGQHLDTDDYMREPLNGQRANTYRRHLGSNFRVILKACSTAAEVAYGINIAKAISSHHDVKVEASKEHTSGDIVIGSDGKVVFNGGDVPSTQFVKKN